MYVIGEWQQVIANVYWDFFYLKLKIIFHTLKPKEGKNNYRQVYGARLALFGDIMFLVLILSVFIVT